ncbi:MAG: SCO family protein [Deltaproteobacteria bacterium]|nr:SCO family protein [Deltaproteobacteria bacterium]
MRTKHIVFLWIVAVAMIQNPCFANFQTDGTNRIGTALNDIKLMDESGKTFQLSEWKGKPFFIHPMFSSCKSTCPLMTNNLVQSFDGVKDFGKNFRVLSLSFDPKENPNSLQKFKKAHHLPKDWMLAYGDESQIRSLMDALDFRYVKTGEDFAHSNLIVLIDKQFKISSYLYGASISSTELQSALSDLDKEPKKTSSHGLLLFTGLLAFLALALLLFIARVPQFFLKFVRRVSH